MRQPFFGIADKAKISFSNRSNREDLDIDASGEMRQWSDLGSFDAVGSEERLVERENFC